MQFEPIGEVINAVFQKKDEGWGSDISEIVLGEKYQKGLTGLADFSHIIVVFWLNEAHFDLEKHLLRRPQGRSELPLCGIFAQRAKDRPNPIGITAVKLLGVSGNVITVQGLDAVNGTPVLDIKPYFPQYDCRTDAKTADWTAVIMENYF